MSLKAKITRTNASLWSPLALRLVVGAVFFGHGSQKLLGWFGGKGLNATIEGFASMGLQPAKVLGPLAAGGEFIGGILLILGLFTRLAALNAVVIMAVAIFTVHSSAFFLPAGMEYALTLLVAGLVLLETGGGALSIDSKVGNGAAPARK